MSLSPKSVIDTVTSCKKEYEENPTDGLFGAWERMWQVQKELAVFFKARPQDLFLRLNVTYAMNDFLMALRLPKDSEIIVSNLEYGAITKICQYKAKVEGHSCKEIELYDPKQNPATVSEDQILENIEKSLTKKTKLVMFSHVMTGTGLRIPVEKIAELLRSKNIFFAVDGAHGAGCCDLDFSKTQVDFYGTNLHKWLMGPKSTGFGWVNPRVREYLDPQFAGWTTGEVAPHFAVFGDGDEWTTRWMICSTHNFSDFYGIPETLKFWQKHGFGQIVERQNKLAEFTMREASKATDWPCLSNYPENLRAPLIAFRLPERLRAKGIGVMKEAFEKHQLVISTPMTFAEWTLRISPNIYNTEEEIARACKILSIL
jgi:isopenicillin-N epimerase